ncbi:hypothetical protein CRE_08449 [Caenorhabditis remanei]|uniref:Uncharacterized protein n=1 Tax=Caenorhabditis remanei TaxID=31234 RepID=E3N032_CAERE|nr:hypothetical protein CRE_08449 [Caenorhabditis remanei]
MSYGMFFYDKKPIGTNFNKVEFYINASSAGHCGWTSSKNDETFELDQDIDKHIVKNTCIKDKDLVYVEGASIGKTVGEFDIRGKNVTLLSCFHILVLGFICEKGRNSSTPRPTPRKSPATTSSHPVCFFIFLFNIKS